MDAKLVPLTTLLSTHKRYVVCHRRARKVHTHSRGLESLRHPQRPRDVLCVHASVETVLGIVGTLNDLSLIAKRAQAYYRLGNLLPHRAAVLINIKQYRRLDE